MCVTIDLLPLNSQHGTYGHFGTGSAYRERDQRCRKELGESVRAEVASYLSMNYGMPCKSSGGGGGGGGGGNGQAKD